MVKGHSLFIVGGPYFGPGRVCVEFFFVVSGYLFLPFLRKCKDRPIKESICALFKSRFLPLAIPTVIGVLSNIAACFIEGEFGFWGYLWYIEVMFVEMLIIIVLYKLINNERNFNIVLASILVIAFILKFSGIAYSWGYMRGASSIPMGIFLAMLPKIKPKRQWLAWILLVPVFAYCFTVVCFQFGNVEWFGIRIFEALLDNLFYPALIYLSFCISFKCKFFSYLGALSFGLYAFQCPADLLRVIGVGDVRILFSVILFATLAEDSGKRIYRYARQKRSSNIKVNS